MNKCFNGVALRQGTTSVVPQMQQKRTRALAPEGAGLGRSAPLAGSLLQKNDNPGEPWVCDAKVMIRGVPFL
jgi:hypothetical protein